MPNPQRADARRNYARILAVAEAEVAEHGANASLEQIARVAGVGSATVRRHFPTRRALLDAVAAVIDPRLVAALEGHVAYPYVTDLPRMAVYPERRRLMRVWRSIGSEMAHWLLTMFSTTGAR